VTTITSGSASATLTALTELAVLALPGLQPAPLARPLAPPLAPLLPAVQRLSGRALVTRGPLRRRRSWAPDAADILVQPGDRVDAGDAVARRRRPARAIALDAATVLAVPPDRVPGSLSRQVGDMVAEGDVLAERRSLGGLQRRVLRSPASGRLSYVSPQHGTVFVEPMPAESAVLAYLAGTVAEVLPDGVILVGTGLAIAGVAGAGPAATGPLLLAESPTALPVDAAGAVVACAFPLLESTVRSLADAGAAAVLGPGISDATLQRLGWDDLLWSAPVRLGQRERRGPRPAPPLTCVLLSVSARDVSPALWETLRPLAGRVAAAAGSEPGLAPEVIFSDGPDSAVSRESGGGDRAQTGSTTVYVIAGRAEGLIGELVQASEAPFRLPSEVATAVAELRLPDGPSDDQPAGAPTGTAVRVPLAHLQALSESLPLGGEDDRPAQQGDAARDQQAQPGQGQGDPLQGEVAQQ
jgi:hypothetical protein